MASVESVDLLSYFPCVQQRDEIIESLIRALPVVRVACTQDLNNELLDRAYVISIWVRIRGFASRFCILPFYGACDLSTGKQAFIWSDGSLNERANQITQKSYAFKYVLETIGNMTDNCYICGVAVHHPRKFCIARNIVMFNDSNSTVPSDCKIIRTIKGITVEYHSTAGMLLNRIHIIENTEQAYLFERDRFDVDVVYVRPNEPIPYKPHGMEERWLFYNDTPLLTRYWWNGNLVQKKQYQSNLFQTVYSHTPLIPELATIVASF